MRIPTTFAILASLSLISAQSFTDALDGAAPVSQNVAGVAVLALRQAVDLCGNGRQCVNSLCCQVNYCIPLDAQCCTTGKYCPSGTECVLVNGRQRCRDPNGSDVGDESDGSGTKSSAERREGGVMGALVVAGIAALL
ncbi:hypothetical protein HYFRA_00007053 [Hymenoscyphus fraxineus]|uniref:Uncharacterized protein n=1 Tax=Hymenoscyphus fraxineus TaxID=746836 RepID=A0A9N9PIW6_9HELO|nr:hypothetical protein HYFRA_00007053 [Hymenoscyphus fraxineus]